MTKAFVGLICRALSLCQADAAAPTGSTQLTLEVTSSIILRYVTFSTQASLRVHPIGANMALMRCQSHQTICVCLCTPLSLLLHTVRGSCCRTITLQRRYMLHLSCKMSCRLPLQGCATLANWCCSCCRTITVKSIDKVTVFSLPL